MEQDFRYLKMLYNHFIKLGKHDLIDLFSSDNSYYYRSKRNHQNMSYYICQMRNV